MSDVGTVRTDEMQPGEAKLVQGADGPVAIFRIGDDYFAIDDMCPHRAGPLSEGKVVGTTVQCPWHGATFDLKTGAALSGVTTKGVRCHAVEVTCRS